MTEKTDIAALRDKHELALKDLTERLTDCNRLCYCWDELSAFTAFSSTVIDQIEAERQQREAAEKERERIDRRNAELNSTLERWSVERAESENEIEELRAELRGEQEPVEISDTMALAFHSATTDSAIGNDDVEEIKAGLKAVQDIFTRQPKPLVVVLSFEQWCEGREENPLGWVREAMKDAYNGALETVSIVVKDGE